MDVKIFVCFHKKDHFVGGEGYIPIQLGKVSSYVDLGYIGDDTGNNISDKNPWYCELTAMYWIWKNSLDADYLGLFHYRRFLDFHPSFITKFRDYLHVDKDYLFSHSKIDKDLIAKYDVILPNKQKLHIPIYDALCRAHVRDDVKILAKVVEELYPDFKSDYDEVVMNGNTYTPFNILISKRKIFADYSLWLFNILFEFEKRLTIPADPYQPRLFGFYSERLLNVYFHHYRNKYKIGYLPPMLFDENKNLNILVLKIRNKLRDLCSFLYKKTR